MTYLPVAQPTKWQQSKDIDIKRTAVVVIDVLGGSEGFMPEFETETKNCFDIVNAARAKSVPVIFANDNHIPAYDRELELWGNHGIKGTEGGKPLDGFGVTDADIQIPKRRYNAFVGTDLDITLRELDVDTLIVVGADTNICVLQTLAGAYYHSYKTIAVSDATYTFLIGTQEGGLEYFTRCYDSRVVTTQTVIEEYLG